MGTTSKIDPSMPRLESLITDWAASASCSGRFGAAGTLGRLMANIKQQKKRNLQNERAHERNKAVRTSLKTSAKKVRTAAASGDVDTATERAREASRALDKAASRGVLHKRTAARRKSRLAKTLARASAG